MSSSLKLGFMASSLCTKPYFNPNHHCHFNPKSLSLSSSSSTSATISPPLRWRTHFCHNYNKTSCYKITRFLSHFRSRTHFIISSGNSSRSGSDSGFVNEMRSGYSDNKMGSDDGVVLYNSSKPFITSSSSSSSSSPLTENHYQRKRQKDDSNSKILTLPTILTLARVAAVPLLISTFYVDTWCGRTATTSIFIAAAITDWLDGYLARKMKLGTTFGAFLDPVADKLMVAATLVLLCTKPLEAAVFGQVPWLLPIPAVIVIGREITMSAVREWAASQNPKLLEAVAVSNLGKWKTATQMTALTILLATRDSSLGGTGLLVTSGVVLLYISAGLSVWSLGVYMSKIWRVLLK